LSAFTTCQHISFRSNHKSRKKTKAAGRTHSIDIPHNILQRPTNVQRLHLLHKPSLGATQQPPLHIHRPIHAPQLPIPTPLHRALHAPLLTSHDATRQVPQPALQAFLIALDDVLIAVVGVLGDATVVREVVADRVDAEAVHGEERVYHVAG